MLPASLDDSLSYYEVVCKLTDKINEVIDFTDLTAQGIESIQSQITALDSQTKELIQLFTKFQNGEMTSAYGDSLKNWVDNNLINIVSRIVKFVWFGLDDTGHFIAYTPTSWRFLTFDMIADPDSPDYGRIQISY